MIPLSTFEFWVISFTHLVLVASQSVTTYPSFAPTIQPQQSSSPSTKRFVVPTRQPTVAPTTCNFPASEWEALEAIYDSTNGPNWNFHPFQANSWNFSNPLANPCLDDWEYITCSQCSITGLAMTNVNMEGVLPDLFNLLPSLEVNCVELPDIQRQAQNKFLNSISRYHYH